MLKIYSKRLVHNILKSTICFKIESQNANSNNGFNNTNNYTKHTTTVSTNKSGKSTKKHPFLYI